MANETSSTDITDPPLYVSSFDFDNATQKPVPDRQVVGGSADGAHVDVPSSAVARQFSDGHPITAEDVLFSVRGASTTRRCIRRAGPAAGRREEVRVHGAGPVHGRHQDAEPYATLLDASARAICRSCRSTCSRMRSRTATSPSAYNVSTPPDQDCDERRLASRAVRAGRENRARAQPVLVRRRQEPTSGLPYLDELVFLDRSRSGCRRPEVPRPAASTRVDDVKPENYRWYADNQKAGEFTLYDLGAGA